MKFVYGKQDWKTLERGEENCYLMTNGLGGFSSLSMIASCSRNDQAVLMACLHSPNHRYNMIHRFTEVLCVAQKEYFLSSQETADHIGAEDGYRYQTGFSYEDYPQWTYLAEGVEVIRTIVLMQGSNTVGISYRLRNRSGKDISLKVMPHLQFMPKGGRLSREQVFTVTDGKISANGMNLHYRTNGVCVQTAPQFVETLYYADDVKDGKMALGRSRVNHEITYRVPAGETDTLEIVYSTDADFPPFADIVKNVTEYREARSAQAGYKEPVAQTLAAAAGQFISYRTSTAGQTILAGFPFFEDWGRDTMIALPGLCLATGQYDTAKSILQTFMAYCRKGLMPNLFPEGTEKPGYNTVDASLLFILSVYEYYRRTKDGVFVKSAYGTMKEIIEWYRKGTDFAIRMDEDGLIEAGSGYDQVTWMDVRVEDILPTPRHGKPVEINAYWYNALRIMEIFQKEQPEDETDYGAMAQKVYDSFGKIFWNDEADCLRDVISHTAADDQIRCNQIWAVSLPFSLLPREKERAVVETVYRKLYTPYGLRTLDPADPQFHPFYGGAQLDRDLAYHQGTVWTFPMGAYYLAYLKVNDYSDEAKTYVTEQLGVLESALREGCVGQLPEIYDGGNPVSSKGCFAQAWSVGEILRVYDALRENVGA